MSIPEFEFFAREAGCSLERVERLRRAWSAQDELFSAICHAHERVIFLEDFMVLYGSVALQLSEERHLFFDTPVFLLIGNTMFRMYTQALQTFADFLLSKEV